MSFSRPSPLTKRTLWAKEKLARRMNAINRFKCRVLLFDLSLWEKKKDSSDVRRRNITWVSMYFGHFHRCPDLFFGRRLPIQLMNSVAPMTMNWRGSNLICYSQVLKILVTWSKSYKIMLEYLDSVVLLSIQKQLNDHVESVLFWNIFVAFFYLQHTHGTRQSCIPLTYIYNLNEDRISIIHATEKQSELRLVRLKKTSGYTVAWLDFCSPLTDMTRTEVSWHLYKSKSRRNTHLNYCSPAVAHRNRDSVTQPWTLI